jgi:hypothetical protein
MFKPQPDSPDSVDGMLTPAVDDGVDADAGAVTGGGPIAAGTAADFGLTSTGGFVDDSPPNEKLCRV